MGFNSGFKGLNPINVCFSENVAVLGSIDALETFPITNFRATSDTHPKFCQYL